MDVATASPAGCQCAADGGARSKLNEVSAVHVVLDIEMLPAGKRSDADTQHMVGMGMA